MVRKEWSARWPTLHNLAVYRAPCALYRVLPYFHIQRSGRFSPKDSDSEGVAIPELLIERDRIFQGTDLLAVDASDHISILKTDGSEKGPFLDLV